MYIALTKENSREFQWISLMSEENYLLVRQKLSHLNSIFPEVCSQNQATVPPKKREIERDYLASRCSSHVSNSSVPVVKNILAKQFLDNCIVNPLMRKRDGQYFIYRNCLIYIFKRKECEVRCNFRGHKGKGQATEITPIPHQTS